jgi:hypothetical protein
MNSSFGIIVLSIWLLIIGSWVGNLFKLLNCDFEPSYKGEIIHAIGLVPIASVITVWYDDK